VIFSPSKKPGRFIFDRKKDMKRIIGICIFISLGQVNAQPNRIIGVWLTSDKDAKIEIYQKESRYFGKMIWFTPAVDEKGNPLTDSENPDPAKRNRKLEGLEIISGLAYADGKWKGTIYDPESGKTYKSQIKLVNENTLELTGYVGLPMFGLTETWKRSIHNKE
jgi:uncharacterized protein (DUF2147 family)